MIVYLYLIKLPEKKPEEYLQERITLNFLNLKVYYLFILLFMNPYLHIQFIHLLFHFERK